MDLFTKLFGDFLVFVYHCFDRIVIRGYLTALSRPDLVVHFFREIVGVAEVSKEALSQRTADYQNWVEAALRLSPRSGYIAGVRIFGRVTRARPGSLYGWPVTGQDLHLLFAQGRRGLRRLAADVARRARSLSLAGHRRPRGRAGLVEPDRGRAEIQSAAAFPPHRHAGRARKSRGAPRNPARPAGGQDRLSGEGAGAHGPRRGAALARRGL